MVAMEILRYAPTLATAARMAALDVAAAAIRGEEDLGLEGMDCMWQNVCVD